MELLLDRMLLMLPRIVLTGIKSDAWYGRREGEFVQWMEWHGGLDNCVEPASEEMGGRSYNLPC
jgi:hypothetical protein